MELSQVKSIIVPEGEVKEIRIGDTLIWETATPSIHITHDYMAMDITDFYLYKVVSKVFNVICYSVPEEVIENNTFEWSVTGLPKGITSSVTEDGMGLEISGYTTNELEDFKVTIKVTLGEYSDTKTYTFHVSSDGNSITLQTEENLILAGGAAFTHSIKQVKKGTTKYYTCLYAAGEKPSWLTLPSYIAGTTAKNITGTPPVADTDAPYYEEKVNIYGLNSASSKGTNPAYATPTVPLNMRIYSVMPKWKCSEILIDISKILWTCDKNEYYVDITDCFNPIVYYSQIGDDESTREQITIGTKSQKAAVKNTGNATISNTTTYNVKISLGWLSGTPLKTYIGNDGKNYLCKMTQVKIINNLDTPPQDITKDFLSFLRTFTLTNDFGSADVTVRFKVSNQAIYESTTYPEENGGIIVTTTE